MKMPQHRKQLNKPLRYFSISDACKKTKYKDKDLYSLVIKEIFIEAGKLLLNKFKLNLPRLGEFSIISYKSDKKLVDFGNTRKLGKVVYYINFHTNRVRYKIRYKDNIIDKYYKFTPYRHLNRNLAKILKEDE